MGFDHKSVLLEETVHGLNVKPDGIYVDGTLGGGGHAGFFICGGWQGVQFIFKGAPFILRVYVQAVLHPFSYDEILP